MRVLVMGGTQFNGLALVHDLANTGHEVVILNRGKSEAKLPLGVERVYADGPSPTRCARSCARSTSTP
jgi:nucleoside-diphosphate-sugar epimerase